jgi:hypothetical protein
MDWISMLEDLEILTTTMGSSEGALLFSANVVSFALGPQADKAIANIPIIINDLVLQYFMIHP